METFWGYGAAIMIGLVLGLTGGGGSILTVPVLVYLFHIPATLATAYSLFVVGLTSAFGVQAYARQGLVEFRTGLAFSIPTFVGVMLARRAILPQIPTEWMWGDWLLKRDTLLLLLFAIVMIVAAVAMIRPQAVKPPTEQEKKPSQLQLSLQGFGIGLLTGLIGAGGGFLIIPMLVFFARLEMKPAVATSLWVITLTSLLGFAGDWWGGVAIQWGFLWLFSAFAVVGIFIGIALGRHIQGATLKPAFGWFVLVMGTWILLKETLLR